MSYDLSLVALFDDYRRRVHMILKNDCTEEFLTFVRNQKLVAQKWKESAGECMRLKEEVDNANSKITEYEKKLNRARSLLDSEKKRTAKAEAERDELREQVAQIEDILSCVRRAGDKLANETKEKLEKFLSTTHTKLRTSDNFGYRLDTIDEINSTEAKGVQLTNSSSSSSRCSFAFSSHTGSLLSDISYTRSEDNLDLDYSLPKERVFKKVRRSVSPTHEEAPVVKKRRSSRNQNRLDKIQKTTTDHLIATTTVTVPKEGPVIACSTIKTFPEPPRSGLKPTAPPKTSSDTDSDVSEAIKHVHTSSPNIYSNTRLYTRPHCFRNKTILKPSEECGVCLKKTTFGNKMFHCQDCRVLAHAECREKVPLPCIAVVETPRNHALTTISDYCSKTPPMIPPLVVHCVIEVEARGLNEVGIYRIPGSEREVRALKERFLRGKGVCSLAQYDIHVVCGTVKDFLRSLSEPLVTYSLWPEFIRASEQRDSSDRTFAIYQTISRLPLANRDTLAFVMQHLQKVSQSPDCKMSKNNLAKVFGPTIVGYSSVEPARSDMYMETAKQVQVVECLLDVPNEYWHNFINDENRDPNVQTATSLGATPLGSMSLRKRNRSKSRRVFNTPPVK